MHPTAACWLMTVFLSVIITPACFRSECPIFAEHCSTASRRSLHKQLCRRGRSRASPIPRLRLASGLAWPVCCAGCICNARPSALRGSTAAARRQARGPGKSGSSFGMSNSRHARARHATHQEREASCDRQNRAVSLVLANDELSERSPPWRGAQHKPSYGKPSREARAQRRRRRGLSSRTGCSRSRLTHLRPRESGVRWSTAHLPRPTSWSRKMVRLLLSDAV